MITKGTQGVLVSTAFFSSMLFLRGGNCNKKSMFCFDLLDLVEKTHGLMNTKACRRDNGPCQKHARTDEYSSLQKKQWTLSKIRTD